MKPGKVIDHPTGEQLLDELRAAAQAAGQHLTAFIKPIVMSKSKNFIAQLQRSSRPLPSTVARVRACVAGEPIPPARPSPFKGCWTGKRKIHPAEGTRIGGVEIDRRRALAEAAHAARRPGESVAEAIKRISAESIAAQPVQPPPLEGANNDR